MSEITVMLNQLAAFEDERNAVAKAIMDEPWASGVAAEYAKLQARVNEATTRHNEIIALLRSEIEQQTLALGESVKGDRLMAVWSKPRITWDGRVLEGYLIAHPELAAARRVGQPSVSIRPVKTGGDV